MWNVVLLSLYGGAEASGGSNRCGTRAPGGRYEREDLELWALALHREKVRRIAFCSCNTPGAPPSKKTFAGCSKPTSQRNKPNTPFHALPGERRGHNAKSGRRFGRPRREPRP